MSFECLYFHLRMGNVDETILFPNDWILMPCTRLSALLPAQEIPVNTRICSELMPDLLGFCFLQIESLLN